MARSTSQEKRYEKFLFPLLLQIGGEGVVVQTLTGDVTLERLGPMIHFYDAGGGNRNVTLPDPRESHKGQPYVIYNNGSANWLVVKDSSGTIVTLDIEEWVLVVSDGSAYQVMGGVTPQGALPPTGYDEVTNQTTTAAALEDIPGLTFDLTFLYPARIYADMNVWCSSTGGGVNATAGYAISINGVDGQEAQRFLDGTNDDGLGSVKNRSAVLPAGTYTVKGRQRRVAGDKTIQTDLAQLFAIVC